MLFFISLQQAEAALGGVPEKPIPGRAWPTVWLAVANDDFGSPTISYDDWRTAAFNGGFRYDRFIGFVDYSIMTVRQERIRSDELTLSVGGIWLTDEDFSLGDNVGLDVSAGVGYRAIGDLGGSNVQESWHGLVGAGDRNYPYEDSASEALVWVNSELTWKSDPAWLGLRWGASGTLRGLYTTENMAKISPAFHFVASAEAFDIWFGTRYESRGGKAQTRTKTVVREKEDGTWLTYGLRPFRYIYFNGGISLETEGIYGALGFIYPAPDDKGQVGY